MDMKGNRSDLNKLAIDPGGLPQSFQQIRSRHAERQRDLRFSPSAHRRALSRLLLNLAERGGSGAQHTARATVVRIAETRS